MSIDGNGPPEPQRAMRVLCRGPPGEEAADARLGVVAVGVTGADVGPGREERGRLLGLPSLPDAVVDEGHEACGDDDAALPISFYWHTLEEVRETYSATSVTASTTDLSLIHM